MNNLCYGITSFEIYESEEELNKYVFVSGNNLPPATYQGNKEWLGIDGVHYIVID